MEVRDLREALSALRVRLQPERFDELEAQRHDPAFWRRPDAASAAQEYARLQPLIAELRSLEEDLRALIDLSSTDSAGELEQETEALQRALEVLAEKERESRPLPGVTDRPHDLREPNQTFLIVCEGTETEPNYFLAFRFPAAIVKVVGTGRNTESLVRNARELREKHYPDRDQYWCVFDRDSFKAQQFNNAIAVARSQGFQVAYSNECFEIWYLLHFDYYDSATTRAEYEEKLSERLGMPYRKNDRRMYDLLLSRQAEAGRNAERLLASYDVSSPEKDNPSTTVHLLVQALNQQLNRR